MVAEQESKRERAHHHRSDSRQSPPRVERYSETDRAVCSNSFRRRTSDHRPIHEDNFTQSQTLNRDEDHGILESEKRRRSEPQTAFDSTLPAQANPINLYQNFPVPNQSKIYIGGLPEFTRLEDLNDCFSQLGRIKNVELKSGYGFVEYDNPQSAHDAVAKYHEGTFLGSQIKVEISHGGSRPRHVAVSNNPEACYTCGVPGHWARDCPDADGQIYHKRRLRARSRSPPPGRENGYIHRDPRHQVEVMSHEHRHLRRRSPLGPIDYIRDGHEGLTPSARERHPFVPAEGKRYRNDHSFRDPERDYERTIDLKAFPQQGYRDSHMMAPSLSRTPPLIARDYPLTERARIPGAYLSRSLPRARDSHNDWTPETKSDISKSAYQRNLARSHEPVCIGGYDDRSYDDRRMPYHVERTSGSNLIDERYGLPDIRFPRTVSPRRLMRSPRRSLSPSRRPSNNYRNSYRAQSPPGFRIGHDSGPAGYTRASYPMRR